MVPIVDCSDAVYDVDDLTEVGVFFASSISFLFCFSSKWLHDISTFRFQISYMICTALACRGWLTMNE